MSTLDPLASARLHRRVWCAVDGIRCATDALLRMENEAIMPDQAHDAIAVLLLLQESLRKDLIRLSA